MTTWRLRTATHMIVVPRTCPVDPLMPKLLLTDISIRALKSGENRIDYWDAKTPAFGIRVGPRTKTFIAKVGNSRLTVGAYPAMSLADARRKALGSKPRGPRRRCPNSLSKPPTSASRRSTWPVKKSERGTTTPAFSTSISCRSSPKGRLPRSPTQCSRKSPTSWRIPRANRRMRLRWRVSALSGAPGRHAATSPTHLLKACN